VVKNVELNKGIFSRKNKKGVRWGVKLKDAVNYLNQMMYPTPKARDYRGEEGKRVIKTKTGWSKERKGSKVRYGASLNDVMEYQMMYPTPRSRDWKDTMNTVPPSVGKTRSHTLGTKVAEQRLMYGTPKEQDSRAALTDRGKKNLGEQVHQENNAKVTGARLSPSFVEFLMGFPPQWTEIE
jgi:hypothetical protein